jgi:carboxyl-terminal processing protease
MMPEIDTALSPVERNLALAKIFQAIPLYFAHWEDALIGAAQLDAAFETLVGEALACDNRKDFSLRLMAFLARLNNGHTRFRDLAFQECPPLGMALRPVEDRWTVIASHIPALQPGDVIRSIEDKPVEVWYEELYPYTVGSPQSRTTQFGESNLFFPALLRLFLPHRYTLAFEDAQGRSRTLTVERATLPDDAPAARTAGRWLAEGLAYIKIPSFLDPEGEARALAYVKEFASAARLIVDVRNNHGGSTPAALHRALMDRPYRWWAESSPLNVGVLTYQAQMGQASMFAHSHLLWRTEANMPAPEAYRGAVLILMDRGTYSAAEDFAMPFKDNGRAVLLGEPTGGSTGQPYYYAFDNGLQFGIGAKRVYLPDGGKFEGVGLAPDVHIPLRREDLYAGRDTILAHAVTISGDF